MFQDFGGVIDCIIFFSFSLDNVEEPPHVGTNTTDAAISVEAFQRANPQLRYVNRAIRANRNFVRIEMGPLTWSRSGEATDDLALQVEVRSSSYRIGCSGRAAPS